MRLIHGGKDEFMNTKNTVQVESDMIYGLHPIREAIMKQTTIDKLLVQKGIKGTAATELKKLARTANIVVKEVPLEKLNRITRKNHQGFIGFISPVANHSIERVLPELFANGVTPRILILDGITDVRNFGSIVRSAECMGIHAIVLPARNSVPLNADVVKTSAGALFHLPICKEKHFGSALQFMNESGLQLVACSEKASHSVYQSDLTGPIAIIMGDEGEGIHEKTLERADKHIKIPMQGKVQSLNVAVATGMILSEIERQHNYK